MISLIFSSFITLFSYYLVGKIFVNDNSNAKNINTFEQLISGFIIISFISILINFFYPLSKFINTIFFFIIIFIFFFKKKKIIKKEILILILASFFSFMFIAFDTINRPDGMIYHYPFSKILNEEKIIFGLSNIHFRFGHTSILQYSSSINKNYLVGDLGLIIPVASIYISILVYILNELYFSLKRKNFSLSKVFLIFITLFIIYDINRYSKIGNDDIGHLISFLIVYKFLDYKKFEINNFKYLSLLSVFAISNKFSLIIFCLFPLIILIKNKNFIKKIFISLPAFFLIIWFLKNLLISGCFLYPLKQTCIEGVPWTDIKLIENEKISGEAWAKDWPNYKDQKSSMKNYIEDFNWVKTWSENHFKIILKNITPLLLIISLVLIYNRKSKTNDKLDIALSSKINSSFLILLLGTIIFFLKFPLYRYGYSYLVSLIAIISAIFVNINNNNKMSNITRYTIIFLLIILPSKQFIRYFKYYDQRPIVPKYIDNNLQLKKINLGKDFNYYLNEKSQYCWYNQSICTYYKINNIKVEELKSYKILSLKKK